jgi:hypothetical protein
MKTNTRIDALVPWTPNFDRDNPLFAPLTPWLGAFREYDQWPDLDAYQHLLDNLDQPVKTLGGATLRVVPQEGKPNHFERHYAPRIHTSGEIQTRRRNWHDFFQLMTWLLFPRTKAVINALHVPVARQRLAVGGDPGHRSPLENMLSLFDEGGVVLLSSDASLLQEVRDFEWKRLFWQRRCELHDHFECIVFGHALYEKGLNPYLGMTANSIPLQVDDAYFRLESEQRMTTVDQRLADLLQHQQNYTQPRDLNPFPLLGMPGWDPANAVASYYDNRDYFRPGRGFRANG